VQRRGRHPEHAAELGPALAAEDERDDPPHDRGQPGQRAAEQGDLGDQAVVVEPDQLGFLQRLAAAAAVVEQGPGPAVADLGVEADVVDDLEPGDQHVGHAVAAVEGELGGQRGDQHDVVGQAGDGLSGVVVLGGLPPLRDGLVGLAGRRGLAFCVRHGHTSRGHQPTTRG
jgi:hypothetical protein